MEHDFIKYIEKEVESYKLYKIQEIDEKKRKYNTILEIIKEPELIVISKKIWLILFIIFVSLIGILSFIFIFQPDFLLFFFEKHKLFVNNPNKIIYSFLYGIVFLFSILVMFLFIDRVHKSNSIYRMNQLTSEAIDLLEKTSYEEKIKYEMLVDYLVLKNRKYTT